MFRYQIIQSPTFSFDINIIDKIFISIHKHIDKYQKGTLNIVFVDDQSIQNLNKTYREKDTVTDVLSFHYLDDFSLALEDDVVWEVILSESKVISQGNEYWLGCEKEFYKLLIHSILHILWYDHENDDDFKIMEPLEKEIWDEVFWED